MMCSKCGKKLPKGSRFCSYCGARIHVSHEDEFLALNRRKNNWISEKTNERNFKSYGRYAAVASWTLACHLYDEVQRFKGNNRALSKAFCPPEARWTIEKDAECIIKALDAIHYRTRVERCDVNANADNSDYDDTLYAG